MRVEKVHDLVGALRLKNAKANSTLWKMHGKLNLSDAQRAHFAPREWSESVRDSHKEVSHKRLSWSNAGLSVCAPIRARVAPPREAENRSRPQSAHFERSLLHVFEALDKSPQVERERLRPQYAVTCSGAREHLQVPFQKSESSRKLNLSIHKAKES